MLVLFASFDIEFGDALDAGFAFGEERDLSAIFLSSRSRAAWTSSAISEGPPLSEE